MRGRRQSVDSAAAEAAASKGTTMTELEAVVQAEAVEEVPKDAGLTKSWATLWGAGGNEADEDDSDDLDSDEDEEDGDALSQEVVDLIAKEKVQAQEDILRMQAERRRSMMKFAGLRVKKVGPASVTRVNTTPSGRFAGFNIASSNLQGSDRRLLVLQELVGSEQDYVEDLKLIVNVCLSCDRSINLSLGFLLSLSVALAHSTLLLERLAHFALSPRRSTSKSCHLPPLLWACNDRDSRALASRRHTIF